MSKVNVKESLLEIVEKNNLEILKIDLRNDEESFTRFYGEEKDESCKTYATLEDLDFELESFLIQEEVQGTVYCQDKDTKEPVWIVSWGDECSSWWQVNRVPDFYKIRRKAIARIQGVFAIMNSKGSYCLTKSEWRRIEDNLYQALKELED